MGDIATDLPKVKKVKLPAKDTANGKAETKKSEKPAKAVAKGKSKDAKPKAKTADAKSTKTKAKAEAKPVAAKAKGKAATAKPVKGKAPAKAGKSATISADSVSAAISKAVASGKTETVKVDYASGKSVADGLVAKAATVLLKAYSDKAVSSITHGDPKIAKAAKELLAKNASSLRSEAVAGHAKKMAGSIVKAAKAADAGKLSAADYRAVAFEV